MPFPATINRQVLVGAWLWTASAVFFIVQVIALIVYRPPYSLATNLISDLGNTACGPSICSPLHDWVNAVFVATGVLHLGGAMLIRQAWPRQRLAAFTTWLFIVAGLGLVVAGADPENLRPGSHASGALTGLIFLNLAIIAFAFNLIGSVRWLGALGLASGVVGFVAFAAFLWVPSIAVGVSERFADYPGAAMIVVFGIYVLVAATIQKEATQP